MNAIIDFFTSIIEILVSLVNLVVTLIKSVLWLVTNIPQLVSGVMAALSYSPSFIEPFLLCSIALLIVFMIIKLL